MNRAHLVGFSTHSSLDALHTLVELQTSEGLWHQALKKHSPVKVPQSTSAYTVHPHGV